MKKLFSILIALLILPLAVGCSSPKVTVEPVPPAYWPTEEWRTSTPEEQGMDSAKLNQVMEYIEEEDLNIHSVMVVRHGYIVLEKYYGSIRDQDMTHALHSVTKSFTSALIGIAMKEGYIESLEQRMVDFFPDRTIANLNSRKQDITLEHMLSMTAGFEWNEPLGATTSFDSPNNLLPMMGSSDPIQYMLDQPMAEEPGKEWNYNTGISHLLSAIITQHTGYDTRSFAEEFLFEPLGISSVSWSRDNQGIYIGGYGLILTPRDMAKLGLLYLQNGVWEDRQIVPADFVTDSGDDYYSWRWPWQLAGYGYHWWTFPKLGAYCAVGTGGQFIGVIPEYDMIVVFTANVGGKWLASYYDILSDYIIESCE